MNISQNRLLAGAAIGLVLAAGFGYSVARLTAAQPVAPEAAAEPAASGAETIAISAEGIRTSEITVAPATAGGIDAAIPAPAQVASTPDAEAVLTARAAGTVTRIFKRLGDSVAAGETLALVESRDASAIAAERRSTDAQVTLAQQQLNRERTLLDQGVSPRADYETAAARLAVAQADAERARAAAGAAKVAADGRSVSVTSPISGRITAANASLGAFVAADTVLFRVADPRRLQIEASVPPADAARIRAGDRVELTTNDNQQVAARVRSATGVVDPASRQVTVVITPTAGGSVLVPGQLVQARIFASGAGQSGVSVPQDAVQTLGDRTVVFVRTATGFRAQPVYVARRSGGMAEIASGLAAGTPIATTNAFLLKAELGKESAE